MSGWIRKRDPDDETSRTTHRCRTPMMVNGRVPKASPGDLWRCDCGEVWKLEVGSYVMDYKFKWTLVRGIRGWYLRKFAKAVIDDD